jgi:SpoVK/Ycf46/Vps4 family AAA+-type ATPase
MGSGDDANRPKGANEKFREELTNLMKAQAPIVQVVSHEWERVESRIKQAIRAQDQPRRYLKWTHADQLMEWDFEEGEWKKGQNLSEDLVNGAMKPGRATLKWYLTQGENEEGFLQPSVLHMEDAHALFEERYHNEMDDLTLWLRKAARMNNRSDIKERMIVLGTTTQVLKQELEKEMPILDLPLPNLKTLELILTSVARDRFNLPDDKIKPTKRLLEAATGLTAMEAELAFAKAAAQNGQLTESEIDIINAEKEQIIKKSGILEFFQPSESMANVGGLDQLKTWFNQRGGAFSEEAAKFGLEPPKGVMLLGIPGCGKSLTAKAAASLWRFPLIRFDLGKVFGGIVGESERNIREALRVAEAVSPCILWIDEIEKGLSGSQSSGQTDGGVSSRVFGTFLTWMQEKTAPVFVLATSNNIEQLPPEMLRKGRFDEIFFCDLPSEEIRKDIFKIHLSTHNKNNLPEFNLNRLAKISALFSGAEIEQTVKDGMFTAFHNGRDLVQQDVENAINETYPLAKTMRESITKMREWASARARLASSENTESVDPTEDEKPVPRLKSERRNIFDEE